MPVVETKVETKIETKEEMEQATTIVIRNSKLIKSSDDGNSETLEVPEETKEEYSSDANSSQNEKMITLGVSNCGGDSGLTGFHLEAQI